MQWGRAKKTRQPTSHVMHTWRIAPSEFGWIGIVECFSACAATEPARFSWRPASREGIVRSLRIAESVVRSRERGFGRFGALRVFRIERVCEVGRCKCV